MSNINVNRTNQRKAREYFGIYCNREYDLHHKDPNLIYTDPERYNEWRPEDLIVLTHSEHAKLHTRLRGGKWGCGTPGARNGANTHPEKNNFINNNPSKLIKGAHWYNNGITQVRTFECPEGYVHGMLKINRDKEDLT